MPEENTGPVPAARDSGGLAPDEIRGQLDRILGHRDFEASPRTRELLRFVMLPPDGAGDSVALSRRLGARFILGGSVRRGGEQVKVSAWLVDGLAGSEVWSRSFASSLSPGQLIETQEEIARCVSAVVGGEYGVISQRVAEESRRMPPQNLRTYEALLRFYDFEVSVQPETGAQCAVALTAAVEREPEHGPLWAALAALLQYAYILDMPSVADPLGLSAEYARRGAA